MVCWRWAKTREHGGDLRRFYSKQPRYDCDLDWHACTMSICILDPGGEGLLHRTMKTSPEALLNALAPSRDHSVVAAEGMFTWSWLAD